MTSITGVILVDALVRGHPEQGAYMMDDVSQQRRLFTDSALTVAPIISVVGLKTAFGDHVVHENLDLTVFPGEILSLVGGSGTARRRCCGRSSGWTRRPRARWTVLGMPVSEMSSLRMRTAGAAMGRAVPGRRAVLPRCRCSTMSPCRCASCARSLKRWCKASMNSNCWLEYHARNCMRIRHG